MTVDHLAVFTLPYIPSLSVGALLIYFFFFEGGGAGGAGGHCFRSLSESVCVF